MKNKICDDCYYEHGCAQIKPISKDYELELNPTPCYICKLEYEELKCPKGYRIIKYDGTYRIQSKFLCFWTTSRVNDLSQDYREFETPYQAYQYIINEAEYKEIRKKMLEKEKVFKKELKKDNGKIVCGDK